MTPVSGFAPRALKQSEKRTLSALRALFDFGAPLAPLRQRRFNLLTIVDCARRTCRRGMHG
jgi:hypothetical protein